MAQDVALMRLRSSSSFVDRRDVRLARNSGILGRARV